ncbi:hypothetical protein C8K18_11070 [Paraburkholderia sp. GV068]|jgi:hypothetical protein|uniref:hypothetical protein n=1 Tax=unclassified Paraburkholderia TaxID=2615204 RepID=UPI000D30A860|nr:MULTISPECIES: hypothetical protein [unclassified Paraburkholderia]PTQ95971.1 hypothetical protein C8K19_11170 [Paraburkholderia sp. GV072]PUB02309.1 hypothetical protein C8K18_11070 [Paraburkholderia sp. GV068]
MITTKMPGALRASLVAFTIAAALEAVVEIELVVSRALPLWGVWAVVASLLANQFAAHWVMTRQRRGYRLLRWIAVFTLVWPVVANPVHHVLELWAAALVTVCVWARLVGAVLMRRKVCKAWIETHTG